MQRGPSDPAPGQPCFSMFQKNGTGEGIRIEASWQHRNLLPPEGAVTFRGVIGTQEQLLGVVLRRNNFLRRDQVLTAQFAVSHIDRAAYDARTTILSGPNEGQVNSAVIIGDRAWLTRMLDFARPREFAEEGAAHLLFFVRRYCAKLLYELEFHAADDPTTMQDRYVELLGRYGDTARVGAFFISHQHLTRVAAEAFGYAGELQLVLSEGLEQERLTIRLDHRHAPDPATARRHFLTHYPELRNAVEVARMADVEVHVIDGAHFERGATSGKLRNIIDRRPAATGRPTEPQPSH